MWIEMGGLVLAGLLIATSINALIRRAGKNRHD